jgi:hypothetical protein
VKELVQVDLSNCTSWNRFLEVTSESISQHLLGTVFVEILLTIHVDSIYPNNKAHSLDNTCSLKYYC